MAWNYTRIDDHTAFTAAALNTPFAAARTAVNAVPANDIPDGAFRQEHLPTLVVDSKLAQITNDTAFRYTCIAMGGNTMYAPYPGYGSDSIDLPSPNRTWARVQDPVGGTYLQVTFNPVINLADTTIGGILVLANVATKVIGQTFNNAPNSPLDVYGLWTIFIKDGGGTWRNIDRAERYRPANTDIAGGGAEDPWEEADDDISLRTLVRLADLPGADKTVQMVAVACSVAHIDHHPSCAQGENQYAYVECQHANLAALVLQSSVTIL